MYSLPLVRRHPDSHIKLGSNVTILNKLVENAAGITHRTVLCSSSSGSQIIIGDHFGISGAVIFAVEKVIIGNNVLIGANVTIYDTDFHSNSVHERKIDDKSNVKKAPIHINDDV